MAATKTCTRTTPTPLPKRQWTTLLIDDAGHNSILAGDLDAAVVTVTLQFSGLAEGHQAAVQFYAADWQAGHPLAHVTYEPTVEVHGSAGVSSGQVTYVGPLRNGAGGYSRRLKVRAYAWDAGVTVTHITTRTIS